MDLERKNKVIWRGGEWNGGEWKGDIWEFGIFRKGTFSGKIWRNGVFKGGHFKGEIWENGIWSGGIWMGIAWKKGYDSYGHLLKIPPDEWPDDHSLLCNHARDFEFYKRQHGAVARFKEKNIFCKQLIRKKREIKRKGALLFHPDKEQNKADKKVREELFKDLMNLLDCDNLSRAERMIERGTERLI